MENLPLYEKLVQTIPNLERKGKSMPYTSLNGNMFSFLDKEGRLSIRLSAEDRATFMEKFDAQQSVQHGRIMKEYVLVPDSVLENFEEIVDWFSKSYTYTNDLKAKPTKKKK